MTNPPKILCLMGPTGSGKTALAVEWVQHNPSEIISVDSAMIYCGMDIGTAKPSAETLALAPHRLIDICDPGEQYSAANFRHDALQAIEEIIAAGRTPLLVGGTMLYFRALQFGLSELPQADATIRDKLSAEAQKIGWPAMHAKLQTIDPESAERINPNDPQRIQRALEIYELTGKTRTQLWQATQAESLPYQFINLAITVDREVLHQRIAQRFAAMLADGLVAEVEALMARGDLTLQLPAMRAVGYRQVWQYLTGELTYDEMQQRAIFATRQLAKRQLTWLRHWQELEWLEPKNKNALADILRKF